MKKSIVCPLFIAALFVSFFSSIAQDQAGYWNVTKSYAKKGVSEAEHYGKKAWQIAKEHKGKILASLIALVVASAIAAGVIKIRHDEKVNREIMLDLMTIVNSKNWSHQPNDKLLKYILETALYNDETAITSMVQEKFGKASPQFLGNVLSAIIELRQTLIEKGIV